ncbi:MAG TPA: ester cyclase [Thermomicrobiales bacterium]|nr:ester cyclase [Thermomicrobiales bacterium]
MTVEQTQQLLDRYLEALFGGGEFGQYLAEDGAIRFMDTGDVVAGREAVVDAIVTSHTVQFAATPQVTNMAVGAGTAGVEIIFAGTHTAEFAGIAATGATVNVPYVAFYTMADNSITEIRLYGLVMGLIAQLSAAGASTTPAG